MPRRFLLPWIAFTLLVSVQVSGCSLIGLGIGAGIDALRPVRMRPGEPWRIVRLHPGAKVSLRMSDGTVVAGIYRGLVSEPDSQYLARYEAWRDTARIGYHPFRIGEPIQIHQGASNSITDGRRRGTFLGFGPRRVHYRNERSGEPEFVTFDDLDWVSDSSGTQVRRREINDVGQRLPMLAIARIRDGGGERRVDLLADPITAVEFGGPNRGARTVGLIVGFAADVVLVALLASSGSTNASTASCSPSYTGGSYWLRTARIPRENLYDLPHARDALAAGPDTTRIAR